MVKIDFETYGKAIIYSYIAILILAFLISSIFGITLFRLGYGLLIVFAGVLISLISTITLDKAITKEEVVLFIVVTAVMLLTFFLLKNYLPNLFSSVGLNKFTGGI